MKRVLITGATGYVGGHLARQLATRGLAVLAPAREPARVPVHTLIEPVLCDLSAGLYDVSQDYDAVLHAAAHAPPRADSTAAHLTHNLVALRHLAAHATQRPGRPFIFLSSISVYGAIETAVVDETTSIRDPGSYGLSKRLGELLLAEYGAALPTLALRLPGLVGPGAPASGVWLARMREAILAGRPCTLHSPQQDFNNVVHLDALGEFIVTCLQRTERPTFDVLNLCTRDPIPIAQVVATLAAGLGRQAQWEAAPAPRPGFLLSCRRAMERYGYAPAATAETILRFAREI